MRISRLLTLSLTLVVAAFALGYANPAVAEKPGVDCNVPEPHPSCKDDDGGSGGGDAATTYMVKMTLDSEITKAMRGENVPPDMCTGTADKRLGPSFGPDDACKIMLDDVGGPFAYLGPRNYCLFGVSVKNTNKGTKVMLFMARDCVANSDNGYHTLELVGHLVLDGPNGGGPDFHIAVIQPADGADLTKINQPSKNVALVDKIFISDMVYKVDP